MVSSMIATSSISVLSDDAADPSRHVKCAKKPRKLFCERPSQSYSDRAATETDCVPVSMRSGAAQSTENVCFAIQMRKLAIMYRNKNRQVSPERRKRCAVHQKATRRERKERQRKRERTEEDWEEAETQSLKCFQKVWTRQADKTRFEYRRKAIHEA